MKSLFAAATLILVLLASCTPKATPITEAPKSATSTAEQIAQGKTILKAPAIDVINYTNPHNLRQYNG